MSSGETQQTSHDEPEDNPTPSSTRTADLWSSQILESKLHNALRPFFEAKLIQLIILYHGNLSTKCCNFLENDMRNRKAEYKSLKPKTFTVNEFTIELWLYCDRFPHKGEGWVAVRNDNSWYGASIHFQFYGNILQVTRAGSADHWFVQYKFEDKVWYHVAITYPKHEFYVNGEFISEDKRLSETVQFHDGCIGHWSNIQHKPDRVFYGKMKEFRLWNCRRTPEQIKGNILCGAKPQWMDDGLIIYHSLDQYNNNAVHDLYSDEVDSRTFDRTNRSTKHVTDDFKLDSLNLKCVFSVTNTTRRTAEIYDRLDAVESAKVNTCASVVTCESVKRIIKYLHFYDIYDVDGDTDMLLDYFDTEKHILNDFHHIMHYHLGEGSPYTNQSQRGNEYKIIHEMVNKMIPKCVLDKCQSFNRNNRLRGYRDSDQKETDDASADVVQCYTDILDEIHCFFIHSYDYGLKVKLDDASHTNIEDADDAIEDDEGICKADYQDQEFIQLIETVRSKGDNMVQLRGATRNGKFTIAEDDYGANKKSSIAKSQAGCYSFGVNLRYWDNHREKAQSEDQSYLFIENAGCKVRCKYHTLREEILQNNLCRLDVNDWIRIVQKMKMIAATETAKKVCAKDVFNDTEIAMGTPLVDGIYKGDIWTEGHIIAVILYCDYSTISYVFSKTFRFIQSDHNDMRNLVMRNSEFFHWSKLLKETVNMYGEMVWTSKIKHFYSGVSSAMVFSSFVTEFFCPTSTSAQRSVAAVFAKESGIIIDLVKNSGGCLLKYFNCSFVSCYPDEDERLFFNNTQHVYDNGRGANYSLKFSSILLPSKGHNYSFFLSILTFIDDLLNGQEQPNVLVFVSSKVAKVMITLFRHMDPNNKFKSKHLPPYISDTFERYIADKEDIVIYGYYVTQQKQLNRYLFHNDFLPHRTTPLPSLHLLFTIFANCKSIKYIFDRYRKGEFSSKYMETVLAQIDLIQNDKSVFIGTKKRFVILESHQYEDALTYNGSSIKQSAFLDAFQSKFKQKHCVLRIENDGKRLVIEINFV